MERTRIMLACSAGMSTSMLVARMQTAAKEQNKEYDIFAVPVAEASENALKNPVDVLLLGPQVRFMEPEFKQKLEPAGMKVGVIPMTDYGTMNGGNVIAFAEKLIRG